MASSLRRVRAFAPGSIGNVGPGLDILGLAVTGAGDAVTITSSGSTGLVVRDAGHPDLPRDPARNTAAIAARAVFRRVGFDGGAEMVIEKGLPLSGGQGGSAASAVAGAFAANYFVDANLDDATLLLAALEGEAIASGHHADNLAPSLLGGLILIRRLDPVELCRIPTPEAMRIVLVHPNQRMNTREARTVLPAGLPLQTALEQAATVAAMVAASMLGDIAALGRAIDDQIAEPVRAPLLPGFVEAKAAALEAGAAGCSISGAGPTAFAICRDDATGKAVARAMIAAYARRDVVAHARVCQVDEQGARLA